MIKVYSHSIYNHWSVGQCVHHFDCGITKDEMMNALIVQMDNYKSGMVKQHKEGYCLSFVLIEEASTDHG